MKSEHIFYFDALRVFAILCVVLLHVTGHLAEITNYNLVSIYSLSGIFETFMNNATRIGIDLFLMLSGALLLGRKWEIKEFLFKRIPRITKPFLFWSLVFSLALFLASYLISSINYVENFSIFGFFQLFYNTLLYTAPGASVYWFFWLILGVYLVMPILNKWVANSDLSEIEYFLIIWLIPTIFEYTIMAEFPIKLSYFTSPVGLVILGYYLRHTERKIFNNTNFALILTVLPAVIMLIYSYLVVDSKILFEFHRYSILPIIEVTGVFCLFKSSKFLNNPNDSVKKIVSSIAMCSYGMYLIHSQLIMIFRKVLNVSFNFPLEYLTLLIVGFILSWIIILILNKIPIINDFIGCR